MALSWTPIAYTGDTGGYEVFYATSSGGPYTLSGTTADKTVAGWTVTGLAAGTPYYFVVQSVTYPNENNQNTVTSDPSAEVDATTSGTGCAAPSITSQPQGRSIPSGQAATLSVAASGNDPLSYQWYQGASGNTSLPVGTNASSFTTPVLTTTTSYWVRVSNSCGHADSLAATVVVGVTYSNSVWVPVASLVGGLNLSQWRSDLGLLNPGAATANVEIEFYGSGGMVSSTASVAGGAESILTDVVDQLGASGSGALEILSDQPLKVTARTYNQVSSTASCYPDGTQGQDYPALVTGGGLSAGQSAYLAGLTEDSSYRSNIGAVNTGTGAASVLVKLYNGAGTYLADYTVPLTAGQWVQTTQPFKNDASQTAMSAGYATVTVQSGSGVFAFASVIDNITNDPTTVAMQESAPALVVWVPVASFAGGLNQQPVAQRPRTAQPRHGDGHRADRVLRQQHGEHDNLGGGRGAVDPDRRGLWARRERVGAARNHLGPAAPGHGADVQPGLVHRELLPRRHAGTGLPGRGRQQRAEFGAERVPRGSDRGLLVPDQHRGGQHGDGGRLGAGESLRRRGDAARRVHGAVDRAAVGADDAAVQEQRGADGVERRVRDDHGAVGVGGVRLRLGDRQHHQRPDDRRDAAVGNTRGCARTGAEVTRSRCRLPSHRSAGPRRPPR